MDIHYFVNEKFLILEQVYAHQEEHITQEALGHFLCFSRRKVNEIMNNLINEGYIQKIQKGRYIVTEKGNCVINKMMEV